jgi:NADH:ubiquinone oxidoreductase subunit 2 (subunit N)
MYIDSLVHSDVRRLWSWDLIVILSSLILFSLFFIFSNDLFLIFINLVGLNIVIYSLIISEDFSKNVIEGSLKYFFLSTISSLFFIGGLVVLYAMWKTTNLNMLNLFLQQFMNFFFLLNHKNDVFAFYKLKDSVILGGHVFYVMMFIMISFIFKLALFPLHSWAAEIYSFLSFRLLFVFIIVLKSVFFFKFIHIFIYAFNLHESYFFAFFKNILLCIVLGSVFVGSITALFEDKLRKILAFSSTNNLGFIFIGVLCCDTFIFGSDIFVNSMSGLLAAILFLCVYLSSMFVLLLIFSISSLFLTQFKYILDVSRMNFGLLFIVVVLFFSFAGLPPLAGFFIKFNVVVFSWLLDRTYFSVCVIFFSVIGCYYYLRVIKIICFNINSMWLLQHKIQFMLQLRFVNNFFLSYFFNGILFLIGYIVFVILSVIVVFSFFVPFLYYWSELLGLVLLLWAL